MNLENLEELIINYFSDIRLDSIDFHQKDRYGEIINKAEAYTFKELGQFVWYQKTPSYLNPTLDLIFILDEINKKNLIKPLDYISYLLQYKGEDSLISFLIQNDLAVKMECGVIASFKTFSQYAISIYLTEKGLGNTTEITELVYSYINLLKKFPSKSINESIFGEIKQININNFKFLNKNFEVSDLKTYLTSVSLNMFDYGHKEYIVNDFHHSNFNESIISNFVNSLIPENCLIILGSSIQPENYLSGKDVKKEENFNTPYTNEKFTNEMIENLLHVEKNKNFRIRTANNFISKNLTLVDCYADMEYKSKSLNGTKEIQCEKEIKYISPRLVYNTVNLKMWYKLDRTFKTPKANIYLNLITTYLRKDVYQNTMLNLYFEYIKNRVDNLLGMAMDAGNEIKLEINENGILIFLSVYSDQTLAILDKLINILFDNKSIKKNLAEETYDDLVDTLITRLKQNSFFSDNSNKIFNSHPILNKIKQTFTEILKKDFLPNHKILNEILTKINSNTLNSKYSYDKFLEEIYKIQQSLYLDSMFYGHVKKGDLEEIRNNLKLYLNTKSDKDLNLVEFKMIDGLHSHFFLDGSFIYVYNDKPENLIDYRVSNPVSTLKTHDKPKNIKTVLKINKLKKLKNESISKPNYLANFFQIGGRGIKKYIVMNLIELSWGNLFHYNIQYVNRSGNVFMAEKQIIDDIMYYVFIVQTRKSPHLVNKEIDDVFQKVLDKLRTLEDEKLDFYKTELTKEIKNPDSGLKQRSNRVWFEVYEDTMDFQIKESMLNEIDHITLPDMIEFFKCTFIGQPKKLSIQINQSSNTNEITNITDESYGILNNELKSYIYNTTDFLQEAKTVKKRIPIR